MLEIQTIVFILAILTSVRGTLDRRIAADVLAKILRDGTYNKNLRPNGLKNETDPTLTTIDMRLLSIDFLDDDRMEFGEQIFFREEWYDDRLRYEDKLNPEIRSKSKNQYIAIQDHKLIWIPDVYVGNEKSGHMHDLLLPNVLIRILPNGTVLFSSRITMVLKCAMNLRMYPFDKPECFMKFTSYSLTSADLILQWRKASAGRVPLEIEEVIELPRFILESYTFPDCVAYTGMGSFSCLQLTLKFSRQFTFYLVQIYIPSCMLVVISWVAFWLEESATEARVSLGVTTILTMVTQIYGINQSSPQVSYVRAMDIWTGICESFVIGALLQFSIINHAMKLERKRGRARINEVERNEGQVQVSVDTTGIAKSKLFFRTSSRTKRIDILSRTLFPSAFVAFNAIYWLAYVYI